MRGRWGAVEQALLDVLNERQDTAGYVAAFDDLLAHLRHVTDAALEHGDERAALLAIWLGYYLRQTADYAAARPYYERALAIREAELGLQHPDTAGSLWWMAVILQHE